MGKTNRPRRQIAQRFGNVALSGIARMPPAVKQKEAPNPVHLPFLGVQAIPPQADEPPDVTEQFRLAPLSQP